MSAPLGSSAALGPSAPLGPSPVRKPRWRTFLGMFWPAVLLTAWPLLSGAQDLEFHAPASPVDPATPNAMRDLAERLLPVYQDPDPDRYLADLSALQMAVGDFAAANASRDSLRERRRRADVNHPIERGLVLDIYAAAREIGDEKKIPFAEAFAEAYQDMVSPLSDHDAYVVSEWLHTPLQAARDSLQALLDQQRSRDTIDQAEAVKLVRAYLRYEADAAMGPLVTALDAQNDAKRYTEDEEVTVKVPARPEVAVRVVRPKGVSTPLPAVLELSVGPPRDSAKEYAAHGYVGVAARIIPSRFYPFVPYQHDGEEARAVIEWITRQSWSDGRVAMVGDGYSGFTAWAAAARMPKALKAIATSSPTAPGIDTPMSGGIFQSSAFRWSLQATNLKPSLDAALADDEVWRALNEKWYRSGRRYRDLGLLYGAPNPVFIRWLNHPSYDRFWQSMIPYRRQFAHVGIPVLTTTGYFDEAAPAALYYFGEHLRYDPQADHTLLIGPFDDNVIRHGALASARMRDYEVDPAARIELKELRYLWLDHVLKGSALPPQLSDRVNYEVMGANEWRHARTLESMAGGFEKLYLDAAAAGDGHRLTRRRNSKLAAVTQTVRLTDRRDAGWLPPTDLISRSLVTRNAVLYSSDAFAQPMELSGLFKAHLDFIVNKMDIDLNISLYERRANGEYLRLFNPALELRLSYAQDREHRRLLKDGESQQIALQSERITSRLLEKGSRLVVVIRIAKRPDREINYGTGNDVSEETIADGKVPIKARWFNDSYFEVPLRAAAQAGASAAAAP